MLTTFIIKNIWSIFYIISLAIVYAIGIKALTTNKLKIQSETNEHEIRFLKYRIKGLADRIIKLEELTQIHQDLLSESAKRKYKKSDKSDKSDKPIKKS